MNKSATLANKMEKLTNAVNDSLNVVEEIELLGDDVIDIAKTQTSNVNLAEVSSTVASEIINLNNMVEDFLFVRASLKENTLNGRRVLNSVTLALLETNEDKKASLITSFAELNKAIAENVKLYMSAYKEISNVLLNISKIKLTESPNIDFKKTNDSEVISTLDLIKKLSGE